MKNKILGVFLIFFGAFLLNSCFDNNPDNVSLPQDNISQEVMPLNDSIDNGISFEKGNNENYINTGSETKNFGEKITTKKCIIKSSDGEISDYYNQNGNIYIEDKSNNPTKMLLIGDILSIWNNKSGIKVDLSQKAGQRIGKYIINSSDDFRKVFDAKATNCEETEVSENIFQTPDNIELKEIK